MRLPLVAALLVVSGCQWVFPFSGSAVPPDVPVDAPDAPDGDIDGDGVVNRLDNCPTVRNPGQYDEDGDGLGDVCDLCPHLGVATDDSDGDGLGNLCDPDSLAVDCVVLFDGFNDKLTAWGGSTTVSGSVTLNNGSLTSKTSYPAEAVITRLSLETPPSAGQQNIGIKMSSSEARLTITQLGSQFSLSVSGQSPVDITISPPSFGEIVDLRIDTDLVTTHATIARQMETFHPTLPQMTPAGTVEFHAFGGAATFQYVMVLAKGGAQCPPRKEPSDE